MLDIITCANFGVEKLRGLGNTRGQILEFPIEMAGHLYNRAGATAQPVMQQAWNFVSLYRIVYTSWRNDSYAGLEYDDACLFNIILRQTTICLFFFVIICVTYGARLWILLLFYGFTL